MSDPDRPRRVVVVDDSPLQCAAWRQLLESRYGRRVDVETHCNPVEAIRLMAPDVHLLLLDWDMPEMDGKEFFHLARDAGANPKRIIICSSHPADRLHDDHRSEDQSA